MIKKIKDTEEEEYIIKEKKPYYKKWWFILIIFFGIGVLVQVPEMFSANSKIESFDNDEIKEEVLEYEELNTINTDNEELLKIENTLNEIGISNIKSVELDENIQGNFTYTEEDGWGSEEGYRVSANGIENIRLFVDDGKLLAIVYGDNTLYENNEIIGSILDLVISNEEFIEYTDGARNIVIETLNTPNKLKFPLNTLGSDDWKIRKDDGVMHVQSYVDGKNAFGTEVREMFQVSVDIKSKEVLEVIIGENIHN